MSRRRVDALARLRALPDEVLALLAEAAIAELDAREGDTEGEVDDHDGCEAEDVTAQGFMGVGNPEDAEEDDPPGCTSSEDGHL